MTEQQPDNRLRLLMWFGLLAPPIAFVFQFVLGYGVTEAACGPAGMELQPPVNTWTIVLMCAAATVAVLGLVSAVTVFRKLRDEELDGPPPGARVYFLSVVAIVTTPLFLAIILMSSIGVLVLEKCHQS